MILPCLAWEFLKNSKVFAIFISEEKLFSMYYLVIQNLGRERCIHMSEEDVYFDGSSFSCTPVLENHGSELHREIHIRCIEFPDPPLKALVFRD